MWFWIILGMVAATGVSVFYTAFRLSQVLPLQKLKEKSRLLPFLVCAAGVCVLALVSKELLGGMSAMLVWIHSLGFLLLFDLGTFIYKKVCKKDANRVAVLVCAVVVTAGYLVYGWVSAHHISRTEYAVETKKEVPALRIVQISDAHIGTIFGGEKFGESVERINAEKPDLVVITGDFVDDGTSPEDLYAACGQLGKLQTKYGVYFVFGNHDRGYYDPADHGWSAEDLVRALTENGVRILEDESVVIAEHYLLVGRKDASKRDRAEIGALLEQKDLFSIVLDHQPVDADAEAEAGADLVLCGHTHGGQLFPINFLGEWFGLNDYTYGMHQKGETAVIVSSGIGDWEMAFKTGCKAEYVVIEVKTKD